MISGLIEFDLEQELKPFDRAAALTRPNPFKVLDPTGDALKKYRIISFWGGRGSGKTYAVADFITRVMGMSKLQALCGREYMVSIADSSKAELEASIERRSEDSKFSIQNNYIKHKKTGSKVMFKGLSKNIESIKSIANIKLVWNEEAQTSSKNTLEKLLPSIRTPGNRIINTMNPEDEDAFVYQEMIAKAGQPGYEDRLAVAVNYYDNPYFTESLESDRQNALQRVLDAPNEEARGQAIADYCWIWLGHTKQTVGNAVLKRVEVRSFTSPDIGEVEFRFGADWSAGGSDPTAGVRCFIANDEKGQACLWVDFDLCSNNASLDELPELFGASLPGLVNTSGPNPTIIGDSSLPLAINKLNEHGIDCEPAKKGDGSIVAGLTLLNNFNRIYVHPRCVDTIREFKAYRWKVDRMSGKVLPVLQKGNDHIADALRYSVEDLSRLENSSFFSFITEHTTLQYSVIGSCFIPKPEDESAPKQPDSGFFGLF